MAFTHQKGDFIINKDSVDILFLFSEGVQLNKMLYCNEICEKFGIHIKCPIKMDTKKLNINSMTFNVSCIIDNNMKYALKCYKNDIVKGEDLKFEVLGNTKNQCKHGSVIEGRTLNGSARKDAQQKLLNKMPKQVRTEAIAFLDEEQCKAGNITSVHPLTVYQKARSEALARKDLNKDCVTDLQEKAKFERKHGELFIQHIAILPFSVILFCEENLKILHHSIKSNKNIQGYLDATGGVVRRVSANNLLNHCLVFPIKSNSVNNTNCVLVLAELITEDNCSYNIDNFLRLVKTKFQLLFKSTRLFRSIVTDKSFANINAIIQSQNRITFLEYLKKLYEERMELDEIKDITFVFLCSSHLAKIWKSDIKKWFKYLDNEEIYFICSLIGNAVNIRHYKELQKYLRNVIKLFLKKKADSDYEQILQKLKEAVCLNDNWIFHNNSAIGDVYEPDESLNNKQKECDSSEALYKQSPFYTEFENYVKNLILEEDEDCEEQNAFCSPGFVKHFLKNSIAILPLWSAVFFSIGIYDDDQIQRPNNGYVEGHFSSLKNSFRTDLSWGKLGTIKIGRYVEAVRQQNHNRLKEIKLNIPNKHVSRKKKDSSLTPANLSAEREQWRGKSKKSSTVMFNRESLIQKFDSVKSMSQTQK